MSYYRDRHEVIFSLVTDVRGAHRLIEIREDVWGMLACEFEREI